MTLKQQLLSYYKENTENFNHDIEELDSWNGYLGSKRYYPMEDYSDYLDERFVEEIIKNGSDHLTLSPNAQEIIEDYKEENNEENKIENVEKVNDQDTDAQREHLLDEIDRTKVVDDLLSAAGIWSIRDVDRFLEDADLDDLRNLKDDLEIYDKKHRQIEERR